MRTLQRYGGKIATLLCATLLLNIALATPALATPAEALNCLARAYPDHLLAPTEQTFILSREGQRYEFDPKTVYRGYEDELEAAGLYSQLRQPYPMGVMARTPDIDSDPGRLRHTPLFLDMYGSSAKAVQNNLVPVYWAPCRCNLDFSKVNGAATALAAVGEAIEKAGLSNYVARPLGTFNWRKIAGTNRLSMHAFGIALDFKLPGHLGRYWRWEHSKAIRFPAEIFQDPGLNQVVDIFEAHGFIWGGKWWHYDSIHFEYRPELTTYRCAQG